MWADVCHVRMSCSCQPVSGVKLTKPVRGMQAYGSSSYGIDMQDRPPALLNAVRGLLSGSSLSFDGYDSDDDPTSIVGKRLCIKWKSEKCAVGV